MLVRNWILELRSNKKKTEKQTKWGTGSENLLLEYQAVHKKNLRRKEERPLFALKTVTLWFISS
jgi:hypothetical protein